MQMDHKDSQSLSLKTQGYLSWMYVIVKPNRHKHCKQFDVLHINKLLLSSRAATSHIS